MNIYTIPGAKVIFSYPTNGYDGDNLIGRQYLTVGYEYTVQRVSIGRSSSRVYLKEVPDIGFNTCMFEDII